MKNSKFVLLLLCLLFFACTNPQENTAFQAEQKHGILSGLVLDMLTQSPLKGAKLSIVSTTRKTYTDSLGYFYFDSVQIGAYEIVAYKPEFLRDTLSVTILEGDTSKLIIELSANFNYWSEPTNDATILFFRNSEDLIIDSTQTGKIQFRLDIARTAYAKIDTFQAMPSWAFGDLLMKIPDSIFNKIDFETSSFNYYPLDSISNIHHLVDIEPLFSSGDYDWIKLALPTIYNIPVLAQEYIKLEVVLNATPNSIGFLAEGPPFDIWLEIEDGVYKFWFYLNTFTNPNELYYIWEVHVLERDIIYFDRY